MRKSGQTRYKFLFILSVTTLSFVFALAFSFVPHVSADIPKLSINSNIISNLTSIYPKNLLLTELKNFEEDIQVSISFENSLSDSSLHLALMRAVVTSGSQIQAYTTVYPSFPYNSTSVNDTIDTGLKGGTTYSYYIETRKSDGTVVASSTKIQIYLPKIPTLSATALADGMAKLTWSLDSAFPSSEYSGLIIMRADVANPGQADFHSIAEVAATSTEYTNTMLKAGGIYTYTIMLKNNAGTPYKYIIGSAQANITAQTAASVQSSAPSSASSETSPSSAAGSQSNNNGSNVTIWMLMGAGIVIVALGTTVTILLIKMKKK